jgi:ABC-type uncharacterized transport system substrate-binding protein
LKRLRPAAHAPEVGCLASYGIKLSEGWAMLAALTDKMLKGAPGETPAQQPTKFELAINLKPRTEAPVGRDREDPHSASACRSPAR